MWLLALFVILLTLAHGFRRDSVESPPTLLTRSSAYNLPFGWKSLPLRTAVEKVPTFRER